MLISLDLETAEGRYSHEPAEGLTPERIYERQWALTVLDRVLDRLRAEATRTGKAELFDCMHMSIFGDQSHPSHAETAARLRMSEGALKVALHRLRRRFQVVMREEIANTVATTEEIDEEIRYLLLALNPTSPA